MNPSDILRQMSGADGLAREALRAAAERRAEVLPLFLERFVKTRLSAHAYPREIEFVEHLPRTPSGKLQHFILGRREIDKAR